LGYAREVYFWSFVVSLSIFIVGAGVSAYEGVQRIRDPRAIEHPLMIYIVLAVSLVFEGASWIVGVKAFRAATASLGWWQAFRRSKDPPAFIVVFEDSAALLGIVVAAAGTTAALLLDDGRWDGAASFVIALILTGVALLLAQESKALLIGERADPALANAVIRIAKGMPGVCSANSIVTVQLAPQSVVATLSLDFFDHMTAPEIERSVADLEQKIRAEHPEVTALFVKPQSVGTVQVASDALMLTPDDIFGSG
jgi:divalent metal cation (Fe/Co/Zn/Cd) transporter